MTREDFESVLAGTEFDINGAIDYSRILLLASSTLYSIANDLYVEKCYISADQYFKLAEHIKPIED